MDDKQFDLLVNYLKNISIKLETLVGLFSELDQPVKDSLEYPGLQEPLDGPALPEGY
jgi:hypothetical protein